MIGADAAALLNMLKTGDLVLFTGQGLARGLFRWFGRTAWMHVGLVVRAPDDPEPLLWEAGCEGPRRGTSVVRVAVRLAAFRGKMSARCLDRPLAGAQHRGLEALRQEMAERTRPRGLLDLMGAADDGWLGTRRDILGDPTDAELVAEVYQRLGLLPDLVHGGMLSSEYRPRHFAEAHALELKNGYRLGPELLLRDRDHPAGWADVSQQPARA